MSIALQEISITERIVNADGRFWTGSGNTDFSAPKVIQKSALVQELTALPATRAFSLPLNY